VPFINGRFYLNPAYGNSVERARASDNSPNEPAQQQGAHWVTIDGRHVLIGETRAKQVKHEDQGQQNQPERSQPKRNSEHFSGDATYYDLPGARTASGQRFDANRMAAAMTAEKAKLGQTVTVAYTYQDKRGNTVTRTISVIINDRGPFARGVNGKAIVPLQPAPGRVIDLTPAAFKSLVGTTKPGHVHVTVTVPK